MRGSVPPSVCLSVAVALSRFFGFERNESKLIADKNPPFSSKVVLRRPHKKALPFRPEPGKKNNAQKSGF